MFGTVLAPILPICLSISWKGCSPLLGDARLLDSAHGWCSQRVWAQTPSSQSLASKTGAGLASLHFWLEAPSFCSSLEPDQPLLGPPHHLAPTQPPGALVLEKTLESSLTSKEIRPVNAK